MFSGGIWPGLAILIGYGSVFTGLTTGRFLGKLIGAVFSRPGSKFQTKLSQACGAFGFLFLPTVFLHFLKTNHLANVNLGPVELHIFWALVVGFCVFKLGPFEENK